VADPDRTLDAGPGYTDRPIRPDSVGRVIRIPVGSMALGPNRLNLTGVTGPARRCADVAEPVSEDPGFLPISLEARGGVRVGSWHTACETSFDVGL